MAQYKVIQDIEAEDKLLGPLSLRQFIYAGIAALLGYLSFIAISKGAVFLLIIFVPPMLFCMFFAWPWSPDQPTEVWALARIRFFLKPRRRIWDQSGMKDLVTVTAPKMIEKTITDGLSQIEVRSRLSALADTIDSRGWAVKNANVNISTTPAASTELSDRLIPQATMPQPVNDLDIQAGDDMLDAQNNPIAQQFDQMIEASSKNYREKLMQKINGSNDSNSPNATPPAQQPPADYWFLNQPDSQQKVSKDNAVFANPTLVQPGDDSAGPQAATPTADDQAIAEQIAKENQQQQHKQTMHLKTINPVGQQPAQPVPPASDPAILGLAGNNDFDVATLARQAKQARDTDNPDDEVVIPLR